MRIELLELPQDKFRIEELIESQLLLRLLKAKTGGEFEELIGGLSQEDVSQIRKDLKGLNKTLKNRVRTIIENKQDAALQHPVPDNTKFLSFLTMLKPLIVICFNKTYDSFDRLLQLAETHPSLEVFVKSVDILVNCLKKNISRSQDSKLNLQPKLINLLRSYSKSRKGSGIERCEKERFGDLTDQDQLRLSIFLKVQLYIINPNKYLISEEEMQSFFELLRDQPYKWLLGLLQNVKSEHLMFVFRDILDAKLILEPKLHYEGNTRYLHKDLIAPQAMQIAANGSDNIQWKYSVHQPEAIITTDKGLYFKFNTKIYEKCINKFSSIFDDGELDEETETNITQVIEFVAKLLNEFDRDFCMLTKEGEKKLTIEDKLDFLEINIRTLEGKGLRFLPVKPLLDSNVIKNTLKLVDELLKQGKNTKMAWQFFNRCLNIFIELGATAGSMSLFAATDFPEMLIRILDSYELPKDDAILSSIFVVASDYIEVLLKKANRPIQGLSTSFGLKLLKAYFDMEPSSTKEFEESAFQHYLNVNKSPEAQLIFNEFVADKLKELNSPEYSIEKIMDNPKLREKVKFQINKIEKVLECSVFKLAPQSIKLLASKYLENFTLFSEKSSRLQKLKKKLEVENAEGIFRQALDQAIEYLQKQPFSKLSIECILSEFGSNLSEEWSNILNLFKNINTIIVLNSLKKGDYSEASFGKIFTVLKLLCKVEASIKDRIVKFIYPEGPKKITQLSMIPSLRDKQILFPMIHELFVRLRNGLDAIKNHQTRSQQILSLDEQLNYVSGFRSLFEMVTQNGAASKNELSEYIDCLDAVLYGFKVEGESNQILPLHLALNLYVTLREPLLKTVNTLIVKIQDKKLTHETKNPFSTNKGIALSYFSNHTIEEYEKDSERRFAQSVNKLLWLIFFKPIGTNFPFKYKSNEYPQTSSAKMALGMYLDELDQLIKTVSLENIELYSRCIRHFLQPNFYEGLLQAIERRPGQAGGFRHNNRAVRQAMEQLLQMGIEFEVARLALSSVQQPDPELAIEWIRDNQDQIDNLQRDQISRTMHQSTQARKKPNEPTDPNTIVEVDVSNLAEKMMPQLRKLIKDFLLVNLYSDYSELIQTILIECIERFDKEESRLKNYKLFLEKVKEDFFASETKKDGVIAEINQRRISIDMALLKLIIEKCQTKKEIKELYLSGKFFVELLSLLQFICKHEKKISLLEEKIIESGVSIVTLLMPGKRKNQDQTKVSSEVFAMMSTLLSVTDSLSQFSTAQRRKTVEGLIVQCIQKSADSKNKDISQSCIEIIFRLLSSENVENSVNNPIESLLMNQEELVEANIQSEIKAYFFTKKGKNNGVIKVQKMSFLTALDKYAGNQRFSKICKTILKKQHEKPTQGNKKLTNLIYNPVQHKFNESLSLKKDFIKYTPNGEIARIIKILVNAIFKDDNISLVHLQILHQVLNRFPLLVPFTLNHPVFGTEGKFLDAIIQKSNESETQLWYFMFFLCLRCPLVVKYGQKEELSLYSDFIQARILLRFKSVLCAVDSSKPTPKQSWLLLQLCNLLQLRSVNALSNALTSLTDQSSVRSVLQKLLVELKSKNQLVFVGQALTLIYKELTMGALKGRYKLYDEVREGSIEEQIIALPLIYAEGNGENGERGLEFLDEEEIGQAMILALERRLSREAAELLRRRTGGERQNIEFIPIEPQPAPKESKEKDQKDKPKEEPKKLEEAIEEPQQIITLEKHVYVDRDYDYNIRQVSTIQKLAPPNDFSALANMDLGFEFRPSRQPNYQITRNSVLRTRLTFLSSSLRPKKEEPIQPLKQKAPEKESVRPSAPPRRLFREPRTNWFQMLQPQLRQNREPSRQQPERSLSEEQDQPADQPSDGDMLAHLNLRVRDLHSRLDMRRRLLAERAILEAERDNERVFMERMMAQQREQREVERVERDRVVVDDQEIERGLEEYVEPKVQEEKKPQPDKKDEQKKPEAQNKPEGAEEEKKPDEQKKSVEPSPPTKEVQIQTTTTETVAVQAEPEVKKQAVEVQVQVPKKTEEVSAQIPNKTDNKEPVPEPKPEVKVQTTTQVEVKKELTEPEKPKQPVELPNEQKVVKSKQPPNEQKIVKPEQKKEEQPSKQSPKEVKEAQQVPSVPPQPTAVVPAPPAPVPQAPPAVFRPVLEAMNLPQSFLRDNGLEQDLFDTLPQSIQIEILASTMQANPPAHPPRPEQHKQDQNLPPEIDQEFLEGLPEEDRREILANMQPRNLVNEHVALLASIEDPALREEMLAEAPPEMLAALPAEMQAEAEMIRQRRLRQLAMEYDEEDMAKQQNRRQKKPPKPTFYPDISPSLFPALHEQTALNSIKLLFWCFPPKSYKPLTVQSILQNKLMQPKVLTTLLYVLRNPLTAKEFPKQIAYWNLPQSDGQQKLPTDILRDNVLSVVLDMFTNCTYKDNKFMKEKIGYEGLGEVRLEAREEFSQKEEEGGYMPAIELLSYALEYNSKLSTYLLDGVTSLPEPLLKKIVRKLHSPTIDDAFISNLKGFSEDKELARIFAEEVTQTHHPKISVYAHLLKYKFSQTKHLQKLHLKALASYRPEYNEFLNQIYRIYTLQELKTIKELGQYKSIHRNVIRGLLGRKAKLSEEPISLIMKLPFLMDFQTKKEIFQHQMRFFSENRYMNRLQIKVNRKDLFRMSYNQIMARTTSQLRARLGVSFEDQMAYDAGGVTRDWFLAISKEMFNPNYALFQTSSSGNTYQPSSKSFINPDHLKYFKFIGRIVGKALAESECIDAFFTRSFYKLILGQDLELQDLEEQDFNFYKSMQYYRENTVQDQLTFSYEREKFGALETIDLVPNGRTIKVTEQNKLDFIQRISLAKMRDDIMPQIKAFLEGFHELIPHDSIRFFDAKELELLISGLPNIDLDDLRNNTDYLGYNATDNIIKWFWQILQTYDQQRLAQVIQFITGTSKIPTGGFKALKGMHGPQKVSIHRDYDVNHLPQAHTCYNQIELPQYSSKAILEKKLQVAFKWGNEGFGFM